MTSVLTSAWPLLFGVALLALGNGLQGTLLGIRASSEAFDPVVTGVVMSAYFAGQLYGSIETPKLVSRVGHIRVFAAFASIVSTAVLVFAVFVNPVTWIFLRFIVGVCMAGLYIVMESWLNQVAANEERGKLLSVYMTITFLAMGLSQFLLVVADPSGFVLFILASALVSISLVPLSLTNVRAPRSDSPRSMALRELYRASPLAFIACFGNGAAQGTLFSMGAVYAAGLGLSLGQIALLMSLPLFGTVFSQYPIGMLSDRVDRRIVLTVLCFLSAAAIIGCLFVAHVSFVLLAIAFTVYGALSLPLHSLAIAHANDFLTSDQLLAAAAKLVLIFGVGASTGPFVAGAAMKYAGPDGFPIYLAVIFVAVGGFALYRMTRRATLPVEEQGDFILMGPRTTPLVAAAIVEEGESSAPASKNEQAQ